MNNKDLANDIARSCKIPIDDARKLLSIILEALVKEIRKEKTLSIRDFGRFSIFKKKRVHLPSGKFVAPTAYECKFKSRGKLKQILENKWWRNYAWILANKFARLTKQGDKKGALKTKKMLRKYLIGNRRMAEWLAERGRLPWTLPKIESGTSNDGENEV